jgi:DUF1680 family protein
MTDSQPGPATPTTGAIRAMRPVSIDAVRLDPSGLLGGWQDRNAVATLPHCVAQLDDSGALDNLRRLTGDSDREYRGFWFADSDVYKSLEAAAWQLGRGPADPRLREFVDSTTSLLAKAQGEDGYLNSYFTTVKPDRRWQELRSSHELYCAGHLIQAAVAAARAQAGDGLLAIASRLADLLVDHFGPGGVDAVCGHPEIETALVELYRTTGHRPYLELARRFVDLRGHGLLGEDRLGSQYYQDHQPVREATEATGHAVRQLYLLAGVVDVATESGDVALLAAAERLWESAFATKTYLTGAHGSRHRDEAFGDPYELPPDRAYAETCAAIASFQWNWRLLLATGGSRYADEMERALYNAIAVATGLDGRHFFYSNPLQLRTGHDGSHEDAPSRRLPWYSCACCPPNIARLMASLQAYLATADGSGLQVHQYAAGTIRVTVDGAPVELTVRTGYPWSGRIELTVDTAPAEPWTLALRLPGWCTSYAVEVDGVPAQDSAVRGYLRLSRQWDAGTSVILDLHMPVRLVAAHPHVDAVRGCVALMRGPLVYCLEQADLPGGVVLEDVRIDTSAPVRAIAPGGASPIPIVLTATGTTTDPASLGLYHAHTSPAGDVAAPGKVALTAVPYFLWANRTAGAMRVWIPTVG